MSSPYVPKPPDRIQSAIQHLVEKLSRAQVVTTDIVQIHRQDSVGEIIKTQGAPSLCVAYLGMTGKPDSSGTGAASLLNVGVYLIWNDDCATTETGEIVTAIEALADVRQAIMTEVNPALQGHRKWEFKNELPYDLGSNMAYVQRWQTTIVLT